MSGSASAQRNFAQAVAQNAQVREFVLRSSTSMKQQIFNQTIATPGTTNNILNIPIRNVGLVTGFLVQVTLSLTNGGAGNAVLSTFGGANALSNITFTDLDNYQRINTSGWHLHFLNSAKEGFPFGASILAASLDQISNFGNNFDVVTATTPITSGGGTGTVKAYYWVPLAYSTRDLRGAMFAGVVNATAQLSLTINPTPSVTTGDATLAMYSGTNNTATITSANVVVYQFYQDQLPRAQGGQPILPALDIATQYRLINTTLTGVAAGQDFPVPFSNFQEFLSSIAVYNQAGTLSNGSDINYWGLRAANTLYFFQLNPFASQLLGRVRNRIDFPTGVYPFDFRDAPISTNQTGNMELVLNPITAAAQSTVMVGFESFALTNAVLGAASLPAG